MFGLRGGWGAATVGVAVIGLIGATGVALRQASGSAGAVTVDVPGAMNVSVYCGGDETLFADGPSLTFEPPSTSATCWVEAPLSAAMPLRAEFALSGAGTYRCRFVSLDLTCAKQ
jgi:hypothetical protein